MPNKVMTGHEIRKSFLDFFASKGHKIVASSPLIPANDNTILFTNAGMNQFKDVFLGKEELGFKTATTAQKCVRAGGKHNDLENVGYTARHHTFFEMLGNFSFGQYFKHEAIRYAWEYVTEVLKLEKEKLHITVHEKDDEAWDIWTKEIGVPESNMSREGDKDNFWQMGDTGPCGPCSEIHYDRGEAYDSDDEELQGDRYLEVWNLVFMQYNRDENGVMTKLARPCIDTGMGLERVASILQNTKTNYDTDLFVPIIDYIAKMAGVKYHKGEASDAVGKSNDVSLRVIADHARSVSFLISDGVLPSNVGRGYVLRRIIRRAIRFGKKLGFEAPFLHKICEFVIDFMKEVYPDANKNRNVVITTVKQEEEIFFRTINNGLRLIDEIVDSPKFNKVVTGEDAFKLYDTYGFPVDLLALVLKDIDANFSVDFDGFEKCLDEQRERGKKSWGKNSSISLELNSSTEFVGYTELTTKASIVAVITDVADFKVKDAKAAIVTDRTTFYAESGGQVGDRGVILYGDSEKFIVVDTKKIDGTFIHFGYYENSNHSFQVGNSVTLIVDKVTRSNTAKNHSSQHLLQKALIKVLGSHIRQAGSYASDEYCRFDFNHYEALTKEQLTAVEIEVNEQIQSELPVSWKVLPKEEAISSGATAIFDEKYGDFVRVVSMGTDEGKYSVELCGGTHVSNTIEIGLFKVVSEKSISSGVRRIEAMSGLSAVRGAIEAYNVVDFVKHSLNVTHTSDVANKVNELVTHNKELAKHVDELEAKALMQSIDESIVDVLGDISIVFSRLPDAKIVRSYIDNKISELSPCIILTLVENKENKTVMFASGVSKDIVSKISAKEIIEFVNAENKGKGGGKDTYAQTVYSINDQSDAGSSKLISFIESKFPEQISQKIILDLGLDVVSLGGLLTMFSSLSKSRK